MLGEPFDQTEYVKIINMRRRKKQCALALLISIYAVAYAGQSDNVPNKSEQPGQQVDVASQATFPPKTVTTPLLAYPSAGFLSKTVNTPVLAYPPEDFIARVITTGLLQYPKLQLVPVDPSTLKQLQSSEQTSVEQKRQLDFGSQQRETQPVRPDTPVQFGSQAKLLKDKAGPKPGDGTKAHAGPSPFGGTPTTPMRPPKPIQLPGLKAMPTKPLEKPAPATEKATAAPAVVPEVTKVTPVVEKKPEPVAAPEPAIKVKPTIVHPPELGKVAPKVEVQRSEGTRTMQQQPQPQEIK